MEQTNVKVLDTIENILKKLCKHKITLNHYHYDIKVYMVKKECDITKINSFEDLKEYALVDDVNGDRNVTLYSDKKLTSKISNIDVMVEILNGLDYKELLYINQDIYDFTKNNLSFQIVDVRNQGVFLQFDATLNDTKKEQIINMFQHIDINLTKSEEVINHFNTALKDAKK
ncbi:MAG: hypothetical protein PHP54_03760 [Clostridia bacterium]|nr:hypothetical protein [Clostridia bacterium]